MVVVDLENLDFINTIDTIELVALSFVLQNANYKEILKFHDLKNKLKNHRVEIQYYKVVDWGHLTKKEFEEKAVWKKQHKNYNDFKKIWNKMLDKTNSIHTLQGVT